MRKINFSFIGIVVGILIVFSFGCNSGTLVEEQHPYYVRALRLLQDRDYHGAANALERCLQLSPDAVKAHLRLAMLYEDHLDQPVQAILHYRRFLEKRPGDAEAATVRAWLERAEKQYGHLLLSAYPELLAQRSAAAPTLAEPAESVVTAREIALAEQIKNLNRELAALRQQLAAAPISSSSSGAETAAPAAAAAAVAAPAPATVPPPPPPPPLSVPAASGRHDRYEVRKGDSLSSICREFYGSFKYWPALQQVNAEVLRSGTVLLPGMILAIPAADEIAAVLQQLQTQSK